MPTNNFIKFKSNKENMMKDENYETQAPNGIVGGGVQLPIVHYIINYSIN